MKKIAMTALILSLIYSKLIAGELHEEVDSHIEAFHHAIHNSPEVYLICYYQVEKKPRGKEWEQLVIEAIIIEVVKGRRKVGDKIDFIRVLDGKYVDISKLLGSLHYLQYNQVEDKDSLEFGKRYIDAQDPSALFRYSPQLLGLASEHKKAAQPMIDHR